MKDNQPAVKPPPNPDTEKEITEEEEKAQGARRIARFQHQNAQYLKMSAESKAKRSN